jgi:hypothetical protein
MERAEEVIGKEIKDQRRSGEHVCGKAGGQTGTDHRFGKPIDPGAVSNRSGTHHPPAQGEPPGLVATWEAMTTSLAEVADEED